jgi:PPK2 family polyphosphate:nucleotide phosphotransferase
MEVKYKTLKSLFQVHHPKQARLKNHDPAWAGKGVFQDLRKSELKARATTFLENNRAALADAQDRLYATDMYSVLIVLQAMDAAGKDGIIKHVMAGVNPQGCQVFSFKKPSDEELDHNFLWRYMRCLPERGRIGIFNRSYFEDVLIVRVHPEILASQRMPKSSKGAKVWEQRYDDINRFERHLVRNGTVILKFFLNVSRKEQKRRFLDRLNDPAKQWKFSPADLKERGHWDAYQDAVNHVLRNTSTPWAPWWVIPADHKWISRALVGGIITQTIQQLRLKRPTILPDQQRLIARAKRELEVGRA